MTETPSSSGRSVGRLVLGVLLVISAVVAFVVIKSFDRDPDGGRFSLAAIVAGVLGGVGAVLIRSSRRGGRDA